MSTPAFVFLQEHSGYGEPPSPTWQPAADRPLVVLVGVTGVGKSTTLDALHHAGLAFYLLPDRRALTDRLMIPAMQLLAGDPVEPVRDRAMRFAYTRAYRDHHPGGMAQALSHLLVDTAAVPGLLLFDGLRGENEVSFAARQYTGARFVVLDAPDFVRVVRLTGRDDPFDRIAARTNHAPSGPAEFEALAVEGADRLFTLEEQHILAELVNRAEVAVDELRTALAIVVAERRNYNPHATRVALMNLAPSRTLVVDTVSAPPPTIARQIIEFLRG
jgi:hypothetical protein